MSSRTRKTLHPASNGVTEARVREIVARMVPAAVDNMIGGAKPSDPRADVPQTARQNTFLLLTEATEGARALVNRICSLADRVAGCVPEAGNNGTEAAQAQPQSLIGALDGDARHTLQRLAAANDAMSRIERELP